MSNKTDILDFKLSRPESGPGSKIQRNKVIYAKRHGLKGQRDYSISELAEEYKLNKQTIKSCIDKVQSYIDRQKRYNDLKKADNETILNLDVKNLPYPGSRTHLFPLALRERFVQRDYVTVRDVLDIHPERLLSIDGVGVKTLQDFYSALKDWGIETPEFNYIFIKNECTRTICPHCGNVFNRTSNGY